MERTNGKGSDATNIRPLNNETYISDSIAFVGTGNSREERALKALLSRPTFRFELDDLSGAANSPDLVARLRDKGLEIPCQRVRLVDRDGRIVWPGRYSLSAKDRSVIHAWMAGRG